MSTKTSPYTLTMVSLSLVLLSLAGCGASAGDATLATSLGLLGVGVGAEAATHSRAEISVEIYNPGNDGPGRDFQLDNVLAIRRAINGAVASRLIDIDARCEPLVATIEKRTPVLRKYAADLGSNSNSDMIAIGHDFSEIADRSLIAQKAWDRFRTVLQPVADDGGTGKYIQSANKALTEFRAALADLRDFKLSVPDDDFIRGQLEATVLQDPRVKAPEERFALINQAEANASGNLLDRLTELFDVARQSFAGDAAALEDIETIAAPYEALAGVQSQAAVAVTITFDSITSSVSLGPINNEVTQILLTPGKILGTVADPANKGHWKPFGHVAAGGGPGNSNIIFYMENQGTPILKSADFDPTQFVVANGAIFKQAFSVMAGVAKGNVTSPAPTPTKGVPSGTNAGPVTAPKAPATAAAPDTEATKASQAQLAAVSKAEMNAFNSIVAQAASVAHAKAQPAPVRPATLPAQPRPEVAEPQARAAAEPPALVAAMPPASAPPTPAAAPPLAPAMAPPQAPATTPPPAPAVQPPAGIQQASPRTQPRVPQTQPFGQQGEPLAEPGRPAVPGVGEILQPVRPATEPQELGQPARPPQRGGTPNAPPVAARPSPVKKAIQAAGSALTNAASDVTSAAKK